MKVAVYGVAKNEEYNINTWYESSRDADYHFILDTGSTDNTINLAKSLGINVTSASFIPWDETLAKNVALSLLPPDIDYCIMLDLDQKIKTTNWKDILLANNVKDYDVVEHNLVDNIDRVNNNLNTTKIRSIHSRKNAYWNKYRPRINFHSEHIKSISLDIDIENIIGNDERFLDREVLYQDAWEREYIKIKKNDLDSQKVYFLEILAHQAFNFYERDMFDEYFNKYDEFLNTYRFLDYRYQNDCIILYSTFLLANSLYDVKNAESILESIPVNSPLKENANFKIKLLRFWKNNENSEEFNQYSNDYLISLYADTKTGKHKLNLANIAYDYYSQQIIN